MKKNLLKICIGTVAFMVFLVIGYPKFLVQQNTSEKVKTKKALITRNGSGHFTQNTGKYSKDTNSSKYTGVIYIGESTEGLLD